MSIYAIISSIEYYIMPFIEMSSTTHHILLYSAETRRIFMKFQIISDGACDLLKEYTERNNIKIVPFYVTFDGQNYMKEGEGISHDEFYHRMADNHEIPKSSLPSVGDYVDAFMPFVEAGMPVICICITVKFSGSYNSACTAREQILDDYPDAKIQIVDSTLNTMSEALLVNEVVRMRDADLSLEEALSKIEIIKKTGRIYFTIGSLEYLVKNGRIGKLATIAGDKLGIKPLIVMLDGDITLGGITRTRNKAKLSLIKLLQKYFTSPDIDINEYRFLVGTGFELEEAADFKHSVEDALHIKCEDAIESRIGTTVGCHTGPFPLGIAIIRKYECV